VNGGIGLAVFEKSRRHLAVARIHPILLGKTTKKNFKNTLALFYHLDILSALRHIG
jgi:hypothetical protein